MINYVSAEEAVSIIKSGDRIFGHGSACTPNLLYNELANQSSRLKDVEMVSITQQGNVEIANLSNVAALSLIIVCVILSAIAGIIPSLKAAKMDPIVALRRS